MRTIILLFIFFITTNAFSQTTVGSVNSGALSGTMVYSVGEVYVIPVGDPDEAGSGLMGVLSGIEFLVTGTDSKLITDDVRVYPNPTTNSLFFETKNIQPIEQLFIYDVNGKLIDSKKTSGNKIDLSDLPDGAYIIKTNTDSIAPFKIIKQ